jgi:hypothetical protein
MSFDQTRRDALARTLCARICDDRRSAIDLTRLDSSLGRVERDHGGDPLRVYVAASSAELVRVCATIAVLKTNGVEVSCTWPDVVATVGDANPLDASKHDRIAWTSQDLREVVSSDVLLMLMPRAGASYGAGFETGAAWSHGLDLVFAGATRRSVFCSTGIEYEHDSEAIAHVVEMARRRR